MQVSSEHRRLEERFEQVRSALATPGSAAEARHGLARLGEALEAHFQREDSLYYPTVWALRPEHKEALRALGRDHATFLERLEDASQSLEAGDEAAAAALLEQLATAFGEHEQREEAILRSLAPEAAPAGVSG